MTTTTQRAGDPALAIGPDGSHSRTRITHTHSFAVPVRDIGSGAGKGTFSMHVRAAHSHHGGNVAGEHLAHVQHVDGHWEVKTDTGSGRVSMGPDILRRKVDKLSDADTRLLEAEIQRKATSKYAPADLPLHSLTLDRRSPNDRTTEGYYKRFRRRWAVVI